MVFKLSYLVEIELAMGLNPESVDIQETIERYELLFGIDTELELLAKKLQFSHLLPDSRAKKKSDKKPEYFENVVIKNK